ncbi:hypothetical protein H0264_14625 [Nocardia huaxiensis]|uniref:Uncharacterized protein n=1 Tax=Nocardia huaxiensis TaxID=2755382 RepID=A0A7D6VFK5_9NOCA|nr:hypothetical protein [Nocardia huaxiensis]QLY33302.1 hypothetical protein H0264_14625 [Nocardia huaxiensis]
MFVDFDELQRLGDPGEDSLRSLADAVRCVVDINRGASMFSQVLAAHAAWGAGARDQPPPTLPVLVLSVLAASEMRSDAAGARHSYYIRLAQALLPDGSEAELETVRMYLRDRGAFTQVAEMWKQIHSWIGEQGESFGTSTIPENPEPSRIGYPLSQALIRRSDRAVLTRFFDRMDLTSGVVHSPDALLDLLKVWTHGRSRGFSDRFLEVLDDPDIVDYLRPLIYKLAISWDGKVITAEGLRRLEIRLTLDLDRHRAWWVIPAVAQVPGDTLAGKTGGAAFSVSITPDPYSSMFEAKGLPPVTPKTITNGLAARGSRCMAEFPPSQFLVLADNADAGGWTSVDAIQAYEEHVFLTVWDIQTTVERALKEAADSGWKRMSDQIASEILHGYSIYYGVTFSDHEALESAMRLLPASLAAKLRPGATARPRLINGLPLHRKFSRNTYLAGGEPDLELPVGADPRDVEVVLDQDRTQRFRASVFPIPLCRSGPYGEGSHSVSADGETLTFVVRRSAGNAYEPPGVGRLSWRNGDLVSSDERGAVCGAWTAEPDEPEIVLVRRGAVENWVIDRTGQVAALEEPAMPNFAPGVPFMYFEVRRDRGAWVLQKRSTGWQVIRLRPAEPAFRGLGADDHRIWGEAVASLRSTDRLWAFYVSAWERVNGR